MKEKIKNQKGITLIALVVTIIILLILAGVTLNIALSENGLFNNAQKATIKNKYAGYLESLNMNFATKMIDDDSFTNEQVNAFDKKVKEYIETLEESDIGKFAIVSGKLCMINGQNKDELDVAKTLGITIKDSFEDLEQSAIESIIKNMQEENLGTALKDKEGSSTDWKIITEISKTDGSIKATYGTGYYYIEKGTAVGELGNIKSGYLVNYDTGKTIGMDNSKSSSYTYLDINSTLGVSDHLVFNLDAQSMVKDSDGTYNWGNGVRLKSTTLSDTEVNSDNYIQDGSFKFDGTNFIEINNEEPFDFSQGLTFEFFGNVKDATMENSAVSNFIPMLSVSEKLYEDRLGYTSRFAMRKDNMLYNTLTYVKGRVWDNGWCGKNDTHCIYFDAKETPIVNSDAYISCVYSPMPYEGNNNRITQRVYINGILAGESYLELDYWNTFLNYDYKYVYIGLVMISNVYYYLIGDIYTSRVYNKALSNDEVMKNYNATMSYHNIN